MENAKKIKANNGYPSNQYMRRILIKNSDRNIFVDVTDIHWIEASGNYVKLHLGDTIHLIRGSMKKLENKLDPLRFIRIHRSSMVNVKMIEAIEPWFSGDFKVKLNNGKKLKMSRNYKKKLDRFKLS